MMAADISLQASGLVPGPVPHASLVVGLALATGLISLSEGLRPGQQRLLPVAGLAAALGLAIGVGHALGGVALQLLLCLLSGAALLLLRAPLRLADHFPRFDRALPWYVGATWLAALLGAALYGRWPTSLAWAQALQVPAVPPLAVAALRGLGRGEAGSAWLTAASAAYAVTAFSALSGAHGTTLAAAAMAAVTLCLHLGIRPRLQAEDARRQSADADDALSRQAARLRDEHARFFSFIAHELRSPLGVLLVGLSNLRRAMPDTESAARIGRVSNAAQRMSALIDRHACLLNLVRSDFEPARSEHSPEQPALEALHALQHANPDRVFAHAGPDHALQPVSIDAELVTLALSNLLENAVKYASEDSPIRFETDVRADAVSYRVINDGPPLPDELAGQRYPVLLPMKDANDTRSGFGIGLALAARVAGVHGGHLTGSSAAGQTTFTLTLPTRQAHGAQE